MKTGVNATRLAIGGFIIPFIFALSPDMLLIDTAWYEVLLITVTSVIGMYGITFGLSGFRPGDKTGSKLTVGIIQRVAAIAGGLMLIYPGWMTDLAGIVLVGGVYLWNRLKGGNSPTGPEPLTEAIE